jgi:elongation factor G
MQAAEYDFRHKKQTGGSGQFAHIKGQIEPLPEDSEEVFVFEEKVVGGRVPREYIPSVEKGFRESIKKGPVAGFQIVGVKCILNDGSYHEVDSSDMAFQTCARNCFRETFLKTKPALLEPVMKVEIEVPAAAQGSVVGDLTSRRGMVVSTEMKGPIATIEGEVPLAETFGYSTDLRSMTQGQGTFTMEFARYRRVPASIQTEIIAERKAQLVGAK